MARTDSGGTPSLLRRGQRGRRVRVRRGCHGRLRARRAGWEKLTPVQQWLLDSVLGLEPLTPEEAAAQPTRRTQVDRWAIYLAAARQFRDREGHLHVPRKHVEELIGEDSEGGTSIRLGGWLDNTRRRADRLIPERRAALDELGMRW